MPNIIGRPAALMSMNRWIYGSVRMELYLAEIIGYIESA